MDKKRPRSHNSTFSDLDSSLNHSKETPKTPIKPKKKRKGKKAKLEIELTAEMASSLENKIESINTKLSQMLTKNDKDFIKGILLDTLEEMKDKFLGSVIKRVEIIESEIHEKAIENDNLKKEITDCKTENDKLVTENKKLTKMIEEESDSRTKEINELEQYGRRNNIIIYGLNSDNRYESSQETAEGIAHIISDKMGVNVSPLDLDIAHRLGNFEEGKSRPVIAKFVQRQLKNTVMKNAKYLKNTRISINEDLTKLNRKVLASMILKDKANVTKTWSFDGKLFMKDKNDQTTQVKYPEYSKWLKMDWPERKNSLDA